MSNSIKIKPIYFLTILLIYYINIGFAQNVQWLKGVGSENLNIERPYDLKMKNDSIGICMLYLQRINNSQAPDTINIDGIETISSNGFNGTLMIRFDSSGKALDIKYFEKLTIVKFDISNNGELLVCSNIQYKDSISIDNKNFISNFGRNLILQFDLNFNLTNNLQFGNDSSSFQTMKIHGNKMDFALEAKGNVILGNDSFNLVNFYNSSSGSVIVSEFDITTFSIDWSTLIYQNKKGNNYLVGDFTKIEDNLYISGGYLSNPIFSEYLRFNNDSFSTSIFILKLDSSRKITKTFVCSNYSNGILDGRTQHLETDGDNIYLTGLLTDSFKSNNNVFRSHFINPNNKVIDFFLMSIDTSFNINWCFLSKPTAQTNLPSNFTGVGLGRYTDMCFMENYIYLGLQVQYEMKFGDYILGSDTSKNLSVLKIDKRGNVLWSYRSLNNSNAYVQNIDANPGTGVYLLGTYKNELNLGNNHKINVKKSQNTLNSDAFLAKISDNAIIRGEVKTGPYCAGDTIEIPYSKIGYFDTSNYFIAELSDEDGNFEGKQRELGRVKSNTNGKVNGVLPMFRVASSPNYRIRIKSTAPAIQSYYRFDTLRLLIYSRDKAWAGNDTTICKGDTLKLETFGGTRWNWSPFQHMQDSNTRSTLVWPDSLITYRITISDSSGCGQNDTAYKKVIVRSSLLINIITKKDTSVCLSGTFPIAVQFSGGDSSGYKWQWYSINSNGIWNLEKQGLGKYSDTLNYTMPQNETDSVRFVIYLSDGCTPKTAFANYTLKIRKKPAQASFIFADTSFCPGTINKIVAKFSGTPVNKLAWKWQENTNIPNQWIQRRTGFGHNSDTWQYTLPLMWNGVKKIRLLLSDACSGLYDTSILNITPKDTLMLFSNTIDTALCYGSIYKFTAKGTGGDSNEYRYLWLDHKTGDTLSASHSWFINATLDTNILLTLTDGCMPKTASKIITIKVNKPLIASIQNTQDTILCFGKTSTYFSQVKGGNGKHNRKWLLDGNIVSTEDSIILKNNGILSGKQHLQFLVSDGCSVPNDTADFYINLKEPLKQSIVFIDSLCYGMKTTIYSKPSGGLNNLIFNWIENGVIISNTDSLSIFNSRAGKRQISSIVRDGCSINDTSNIEIILLDSLDIKILVQDSCPTVSTVIRTLTSGGKHLNRQINWYINGNLINQGTDLNFIPANFSSNIITAIVSDGCTIPNDTAIIKIGSSPKVKILAQNECLGDTTKFIANQINSTKAIEFEWEINGNNILSFDSMVSNVFKTTGPYKIKVNVSSSSNCKGSDSLSGFILNKPKAAFTIAHFDPTNNGIPFKFINQSSGENSWLWNFGNGDTSQSKNPDYLFKDTGIVKITLIVSNNGKCFDSSNLILPIFEKIEFFIPNVFSPDENGINESFGLNADQWNKVNEFNIKIYNRWGEKVFESNSIQEHWNAKDAQQGVYIYVLTIRDVYNILHELKGIVELMK